MAEIAQLVAAIKAQGTGLAVTKIRNVGKAGDKLEKSVEKNNASISRSFKSSAGAIALLSIGIAAVGATIGVLTSSIGTIKKFEKSISDLSAITGAAGDDLDFLIDRSKELGRSTTFSASEVSEAFKLVASAKPDLLESAEALNQVTEQALTLAEAAGITLPDAARALGLSLNQFGLDAEEAGRIINVLAAGSKFGASEIEQTALAIKDAGAIAKAVGVSFEELNTGIQLLASGGIQGARAGVALRNVLLRLANSGINELNPEVVGLEQALLNLNASELSTVQLTQLFGLEAAGLAKVLIDQAVNFGELEAKITDTNVAYEQARIRTDNLDGDTLELQSALEGARIEIGQRLLPDMRDLTQVSASLVNIFADLFLKTETLNTKGLTPLANTLLNIVETTLLAASDLGDFGNVIDTAHDVLISTAENFNILFANAGTVATNFKGDIEDILELREKTRQANLSEVEELKIRLEIIRLNAQAEVEFGEAVAGRVLSTTEFRPTLVGTNVGGQVGSGGTDADTKEADALEKLEARIEAEEVRAEDKVLRELQREEDRAERQLDRQENELLRLEEFLGFEETSEAEHFERRLEQIQEFEEAKIITQ